MQCCRINFLLLFCGHLIRHQQLLTKHHTHLFNLLSPNNNFLNELIIAVQDSWSDSPTTINNCESGIEYRVSRWYFKCSEPVTSILEINNIENFKTTKTTTKLCICSVFFWIGFIQNGSIKSNGFKDPHKQKPI